MIDYTAATPKTYWYIHDAHDNVIGLADSSGYRVVNYEYDAWGNILSQAGTVTLGNGLLLVNENPFRYCEYQFDTETGWYYLKSRYYAPSIARFLTRDPMLNLNRYSYAANNPVTSFDPDGFRVMMMEDGGGKRPKIYYHAGRAISDYIRNQPGHVESFSLQAFIGITDLSWESFGMYALKASSTSNLIKSALSKSLKVGVFSSTILGITTKTNIEIYGYELGLKMSLADVGAFSGTLLVTRIVSPKVISAVGIEKSTIVAGGGAALGAKSLETLTGALIGTAMDYFASAVKEKYILNLIIVGY